MELDVDAASGFVDLAGAFAEAEKTRDARWARQLTDICGVEQVTSFAQHNTTASPSVQQGSPTSSPVPPTSFQSVARELSLE